MHLLVLSLPFECAGRETLAVLQLVRDVVGVGSDACVIARGLHGEVLLRRSHELPPSRAAFWTALGRRVVELRDRRVTEAPAAPIANVLRRNTSSVLVLARTVEVFEQVHELARKVGCAIVLVPLARDLEQTLTTHRSPTRRVA